MLEYERQHWDRGFSRVAGIDEAGRGPLAGPVVAAAVVMDRAFAEAEEHGVLAGLTDSKKLSHDRREHFYGLLAGAPHVRFAVGMADSVEIDTINILQATHRAMRRALEGLGEAPDYVLVDGLPVKGLPVASLAIVGGDGRSLFIAAASIVAKVTRDRLMVELDARYPQYGFARHKGYGSRRHMQALLEFGPCPVHRRSFRPVREAAEIHARSKGEGPHVAAMEEDGPAG